MFCQIRYLNLKNKLKKRLTIYRKKKKDVGDDQMKNRDAVDAVGRVPHREDTEL
jgi:hypothetical protein